MKGALHVITPQTMRKVRDLNAPPALKELQDIVGGHIELVPGFTVVEFFGMTGPCVAFVNEDGKLPHLALPKNDLATSMWQFSLTSQGHPGLLSRPAWEPGCHVVDWLVGDIAVVTGDEELLAAL